jgi:dihydroceramidase
MLVGIGSSLFHATLSWKAQLADELPMIWVASYSAYVLYDTHPDWNAFSSRSIPFIVVLVTFNIFFSWT